jgi:raffinose/stachyose/melibiose transport system substrate-binding protein
MAAAAVTVLAGGALAACGGGSGGGDGSTFTILQYETTSTAQYKGWQRALEIFQEAHPDVEVEFATTSFDSIRSNAKILLTGDDVPDVMLFNTGNADGGQLAAQGLLDPLTDVVEENGWDDDITGSVAALARYDENGHAGSGDWYGVPNVASFFTFFANDDLLAEQGYDAPPETVAELEEMFDAFLADGITPVSSNAGEHAVLQTWWQLISADADRQEIDDFIFLQGEPDVTSGAFASGTEKLQDWIGKGYLGSQLAGIKSDEMERAFIAGEFPFMAQGTWAFSRVAEEADFAWSTFAFPGSSLNAGASGHLWGVPANAAHKDLAYDWIATTLSPEVQNEIAAQGGIPVAGDTAAIEDPRMRVLNEQFDEIKAADALSFYPDYPVAGLLDFQMSGLQAMTNGSTDATAFLAGLQEFYDSGKDS